MVYVDVHTHLTHALFSADIDAVIERARKAGVVRMITNGTNDITNRHANALAARYPDVVRCAYGAYPIDALNLTQPSEGLAVNPHFDLDKEIEYWHKHKDEFIAVGEVGLDYKYGAGHERAQQENFTACIAAAEKLHKPIIVHTRKAERDCVDMLISSRIPAHKIILHSFMGRKSIIKDAADHGMTFSIPPIIRRLDQFQQLATNVNVTQLLTETDAPYLGPDKDTRNEPANVIETVKLIATLKKLDPQEVARTFFMTYRRAFE